MFWSFAFAVLMVLAVFFEMLTPSMGAFTLVALGFLAASVYTAFAQSAGLGYVMLALNLSMMPLALWLGFRFMKNSPLVHNSDLIAGSQNAPEARPLTHLLGQEGRAMTPLRPGGTAMIGATKVDVVTQGKYVESGTPLKVIIVEGSRVVVEATES